MNLNFNIKCLFCGNTNGSEFYIMPVEQEVLDGKVFSCTNYKVVCKKCNQKHLLKFNIVFSKGE